MAARIFLRPLSFTSGDDSALESHTKLIYNKDILRNHRSMRACILDLPRLFFQLGDNSEMHRE